MPNQHTCICDFS